jgi:hypothetical protein
MDWREIAGLYILDHIAASQMCRRSGDVESCWYNSTDPDSGILMAMGDTHSDLTHSDYDWGKHHGIAPQIPSKREKIGSPEKMIDPLENSDGIATSPSFPASLQGCYELLHFLIGFIYIRCADGCLSGQIHVFSNHNTMASLQTILERPRL